MKQIQEKFIVKLSWSLLFFIVLQPILDIVTSISIFYYDTTVTIGIVVRLLFMFLAAVYLVLSPLVGLRKVAVIYLSSLLLIIGIGFISGFMIKPNFHLFSEAQFYAKGYYFIVMFISYTFALLILKDSTEKKLIAIVINPIVVAMTIVGVVFLITTMTGTGFDTYRHMKAGNKGLFNAGNEIGAILSIGLPIVILYGIKCTEKVRDFYCWIPSLLVIFSLVMLGTKVGYLAVMVTLVITFFFLAINQFKKTAEGNQKLNLIIISLILATMTIITPFTPAFSNTEMHMKVIDDTNDLEGLSEENKDEAINDANIRIFTNKYADRFVSIILSSRQIFLIETQQMFNEAPLIQKLFGMGYAGNYPDTPKLIEMDFLDLFYSYGIVGFIVFLLPFIIAVGVLTVNYKLYKNKLCKVEFVLVLCSLLLGFGIAFVAGHVLFAPAVSIYLAFLLAYVFTDFEIVKSR
ncbi:O-antigen ligase family protein [Bacillaceae bacterium IKA-2]|nr:O-antigen ligase family protein [Bacillaceae bacterium IKA-2]